MNFELVNSCYYIQECKTTQIRFLKQRFPPNNRVLHAIEYVTTSNIKEDEQYSILIKKKKNIEEPYSIQPYLPNHLSYHFYFLNVSKS